LAVPGGYHEPQALARLLEEEAPFRGLAMVVGLLDYVKLLADQGKPAMEQLMGSVSRLVVSMTRAQDFACRISEDEFVLLFVNESGASANRRIQTVSERLWDFQLRSLGSMSLMFTWGAAESMNEPLTQVLERAREQMLETRRGRRSLTGAGRFRLAAND
jgi:GGDEF domain-containing protein